MQQPPPGSGPARGSFAPYQGYAPPPGHVPQPPQPQPYPYPVAYYPDPYGYQPPPPPPGYYPPPPPGYPYPQQPAYPYPHQPYYPTVTPGHFITGWKLDTVGLTGHDAASMITYSSETEGVRNLRKDNLTLSNNWTTIFYNEDEHGQYTVPRSTASNLKHELEITKEAFVPGLTHVMDESYVFQDGQLKLDVKTGQFSSHWPSAVPSFATKDLVGKSVFTLSTSSRGKDWWNFQLQGDYEYITHTFCGRFSAALFVSTTPGEQALTVYWVMVNGKPCTINGATDWFWFQPKKFLPEERNSDKAKLILTGDPSGNLFLVASYTDDVHYVYLVSRDPGSKTDRANVTLVHVISNITRSSPLSEPNVSSDEWSEFEIYTFASRMAFYSGGRLAVFDVQLRPDGHIWSRVDLSKVGGIGRKTAPRQLGRFLVFEHVGVLDMVTFGYTALEEQFCGGKFVVWNVRGDKLVASYLESIDRDGKVVGECKDAFQVSMTQMSNVEWLRGEGGVAEEGGEDRRREAIRRMNGVEVIEIS